MPKFSMKLNLMSITYSQILRFFSIIANELKKMAYHFHPFFMVLQKKIKQLPGKIHHGNVHAQSID